MNTYLITYRTRKADKLFGFSFGEKLVRDTTKKTAISYFKKTYLSAIEADWDQKITVIGAEKR